MNLLKTLERVTRQPRKYLSYLLECGLLNAMDDEKYIRLLWLLRIAKPIDLENPKTFNEKLQWLKLHDHNPAYTIMADKYEAKKWVAERIGEEFVVPCYGAWESFDAIDFDALPESFVLKTNHDYAGVVVVHDRDTFDRKAAKKFLEKHLKKNHFYDTREWAYKNIKPRIIAEKLLTNPDRSELKDYKVSCFNGEPKFTYVHAHQCDPDTLLTYHGDAPAFAYKNAPWTTRFQRALGQFEILTYYDNDYNIIPCSNGEGPARIHPDPKPENYDRMIELARILAKDIPFLRVDFYEADGKLYVGELTFYSAAGFACFSPDTYNAIFGNYLNLPEK